jgi:hypothetical protein
MLLLLLLFLWVLLFLSLLALNPSFSSICHSSGSIYSLQNLLSWVVHNLSEFLSLWTEGMIVGSESLRIFFPVNWRNYPRFCLLPTKDTATIWHHNSFVSALLIVGVLLLCFALLLQVPVIQLLLGQTRLVSGDQMLSVWRYVVVGAVIAAAVLTPSTDPLTQCLLAGPLIGLYVGGAFLVKFLINESEPLEDWKNHTLNTKPPQTVLCNYYCSAGFDDILTSHHTNVG